MDRILDLAGRLKPMLNQAIAKYKRGCSFYEYLSLFDPVVGVAMSTVELFKMDGSEKKGFVIEAIKFAYNELEDFPDWLDAIFLNVVIPETIERLWALGEKSKGKPTAKTAPKPKSQPGSKPKPKPKSQPGSKAKPVSKKKA